MEQRSADGAAEPIVQSSAAAGHSEATQHLMAGVISFNFGMVQDMLKNDPWKKKHRTAFQNLMDTFVKDYDPDLIFGCEVGGHGGGLSGAQAENLELGPLAAVFTQNYMSCVHKGRGVEYARLPWVTSLNNALACEPQLVITVLSLQNEAGKAARLIVGNLHIRCPGDKAPTLSTRCRAVIEALQKLEWVADQERSNCVLATEQHDPVMLLVGDCNLTPEYARNAVSASNSPAPQTLSSIWMVAATAKGLGGDLCFVKGCNISVFEVSVGHSYHERGMRNDSHDALGFMLSLPIVIKNTSTDEDHTERSEAEDGARNVVENLNKWLGVADGLEDNDTDIREHLEKFQQLKIPIGAIDIEAPENLGLMVTLRNAEAKATQLKSKLGTAGADKSKKPVSYEVYDALLTYFNQRMDTPGIVETDTQLDKLCRLLFCKRKVSFLDDNFRNTQVAAKMVEARRWYADVYDKPMAQVTQRVLESSREGLAYWLGCQPPAADNGDVIVTAVSKEECAKRIRRVLGDRERWLEAQKLPLDHFLTWEQRGAFMEWSMEEFAAQEDEKERDRVNREEKKMTATAVKKARRSRFNLEKQRRAGSSQMWELLSYKGVVREDFIEEALNKMSEDPGKEHHQGKGSLAATAKQAKADLRYAVMLARKKETLHGKWLSDKDEDLLRRLQDGSLKKKVNLCVLELGRGRLHGEGPNDFLDIGTNRDHSSVARVLDGERSMASTDRFVQ